MLREKVPFSKLAVLFSGMLNPFQSMTVLFARRLTFRLPSELVT